MLCDLQRLRRWSKKLRHPATALLTPPEARFSKGEANAVAANETIITKADNNFMVVMKAVADT